MAEVGAARGDGGGGGGGGAVRGAAGIWLEVAVSGVFATAPLGPAELAGVLPRTRRTSLVVSMCTKSAKASVEDVSAITATSCALCEAILGGCCCD